MDNIELIKRNSNIVSIIGNYIKLSIQGGAYKGLCPFHKEKTGSFTVYPQKGSFKCYGCGQSGDVINFIQLTEGLTTWEAIEFLGKLTNTPIEHRKKEDPAIKSEREALFDINQQIIQDQFTAWFKKPSNPDKIITIDNCSWKASTFERFLVYEYPENYQFKHKIEELKKIGWFSSGQYGTYESYKERIIFPIIDHVGKFCGLTARERADKTSKAPKLNSPDSLIFKKSELLFGLFQARRAIATEGFTYLVEGPKDVISWSDKGFENVIGISGSSISSEQAKLIARYTGKVTTILDGDAAGIKGAKTAVMLLLQEGVYVNCVFLPEKEDPDSYCRGKTREEIIKEIKPLTLDGFMWLSLLDFKKEDETTHLETIKKTIGLLGLIKDNTTREYYISQLSDKKNLGSLAKQLKAAKNNTEDDKEKKELSIEQLGDIEKYNLFEMTNQYMVPGSKGGFYPISNFVVWPKIMAIGQNSSFRIIEIVNKYGFKATINLHSDDFVELSAFKKAVARCGNFIIKGNPELFIRIQEKVYASTDVCSEIKTLGWHHDGFYVWSNGVSHKENFYPTDDFGTVTVNNKRYFIPIACKTGALSEGLESDDTNDLMLFKYDTISKKTPTVKEWFDLLIKVHGQNGLVGAGFYFASLFRDFIYLVNRVFPHLDCFGEPESGKSYFAWAFRSMFGVPRKAFNLNGNTHAAFYRKLSQVCNGIEWFDELLNTIHALRTQALKDAYDGGAHQKSSSQDGKGTTEINVLSSCLISGQDLPIHDNALFERVILLKFKNPVINEIASDELKVLQESGVLSRVTHQILAKREEFKDKFNLNYNTVLRIFKLKNKTDEFVAKTRFLQNYAIVFAALESANELFDLNINRAEMMDLGYSMLADQQHQAKTENDVSTFWGIVNYLIGTFQLAPGEDYFDWIAPYVTVNDGRGTRKVPLEPDTSVFFLSASKVFLLYMQEHRMKYNRSGVSKGALISYLKNMPNYIGECRQRFQGHKKFCYAFKLEGLGLELTKGKENYGNLEEDLFDN